MNDNEVEVNQMEIDEANQVAVVLMREVINVLFEVRINFKIIFKQ